MKFSQKLSPITSVLLTFKFNPFHLSLTLQTNAFITNDEIVSVTQLRIWYHTADKHFYCYWQTLLVLEMIIFHTGDQHFSAGDECIGTHIQTLATQAHTASNQRLSNRTYVEVIASHSYSPLKTSSITLRRCKGYLDPQRCLPVHYM